MPLLEQSYITLNFQHPNVCTIVHAKQNDRGSRKIICQLLDGATPWTPPGNIEAAIEYKRQDGYGGLYDVDEQGRNAVVFNGSTVTLTLVEAAIQVPDKVHMALRIYTAIPERLATFNFIVDVEASPMNDVEIINSNYFNVLSQKIADVLGSVGAVAGLEATAHSIPKDQEASVAVTGGTGSSDPYRLDFGIPKGFSPDLAITKSGHVVTMTATDENGTTQATVTEPTAKAVEDGANIRITMTDADGSTQATVLHGSVLLPDFSVDLSTGDLLFDAPASWNDLAFAIDTIGNLTIERVI